MWNHRSASSCASRVVLTGLLLVGMASTAHAQFRTMDRPGAETHAEVQMNFVGVDNPFGAGDVTVMRTDLFGEVAFKGFGFYASLPISRGIDTAGLEETTVGNLELGASHLFDTPGPVDVVAHLGLKLPTSDADDSIAHATVAQVGAFSRISDLFVGADPDMVTVRLGAAPRLDMGPVFLRADLGFDVAIPTDSRDEELFMRGNIGAGVNVMLLTLTGEIANAGLLTEGGAASDRFLHTFALGAQLNTPIAKPHVAYHTPLDEELIGDVWVVSAGFSLGF